MRAQLSWAVPAALFATSEAKALKWGDDSPSWVPPRETEAPKQIGFIPAAPEPTYMPTPNIDLMRRQSGGNNTCGYINGVFTSRSAIVCNPGWDCYPDQRLGVMGCCLQGNNCVAETLCWNSVQSRSYSGDDGGRIRWCSDSRAPYCALGRFTSGAYSSYEVLFCDANPSRTYSLSYFTPQAITTPSSSQRTSTLTSSSTSTTPTESQTETPAASSSSAPAGAIAGGVVGGIAAIGLIVLGVIFLWRRKSKKNNDPPPGAIIPGSTAYAAVSQYTPHQEPYDRNSMLKPPYRGSGSVSPYDPSVTSSALGSPPPGYPPQPYSNLPPSPQPPVTPYLQPAHHQPVQPYPQQYQPAPPQQAYQQQQSVPHELPVARGDGELRELA